VTTVLVLGATGQTGAALVDQLRPRPGFTVRAASRGAHGDVRFEWADPGTHDDALDGVQRVYLVAPVGDPNPRRLVAPFLQRAARHGVQRVVLLSSSAVDFGDPGLGEVAADVRDAVPEWEILRPSWFMQNFVGAHPIAAAIRATGAFATSTGTGRVPFIDAGDIARSAAALLVRDEPENAEHVLTGPAALSYDEAADILSAVSGTAVRHLAVGTDDYVDGLVAGGFDRDFAAFLAALDTLVRKGWAAAVTDTVQRLTGLPPRTFEQFLRARQGLAA
jgi:uncharacterized protein YbjT (DUF2867 family)